MYLEKYISNGTFTITYIYFTLYWQKGSKKELREKSNRGRTKKIVHKNVKQIHINK